MTGWLVLCWRLGGTLDGAHLVVMAVKAVFWLVFLPFRLVACLLAPCDAGEHGRGHRAGLALLLAPLLPLVILAAMVYGWSNSSSARRQSRRPGLRRRPDL
jgi:hypothetical protein